MRRILRARVILAVVIAACRVLPSATAATPEQSYITARDTAIAKIKAMVTAKPDTAKPDTAKPASSNSDFTIIDAAAEKARKELEVQLRAIVGPVAIKGLEATARSISTP
jgi:hypothetical protein